MHNDLELLSEHLLLQAHEQWWRASLISAHIYFFLATALAQTLIESGTEKMLKYSSLDNNIGSLPLQCGYVQYTHPLRRWKRSESCYNM